MHNYGGKEELCILMGERIKRTCSITVLQTVLYYCLNIVLMAVLFLKIKAIKNTNVYGKKYLSLSLTK